MSETTAARSGATDMEGTELAPVATGRLPLWLRGLMPLVLLVALLALFLVTGPAGVFRAAFPPVEELTIERVEFPESGRIRIHVVNGGPEAVTVSQVIVDDAYWDFTITGEHTLARLDDATIDVLYPWVHGEPIAIDLLSSSGVTFNHQVTVATESPRADARYLSTFALLGIYVGVIPVFLGLLWLPFLRGIGRRWTDFFLSLTVGLLVFLGVDALAEAVQMSGEVASAFQGLGLVTLGVISTPLLIEGVGQLGRRPPAAREGVTSASARRAEALRVATLIAVGIGLHNLGEGLAIGSAYAAGELALGSALVVGFLLHNTTEGIGIVAPLARQPAQITLLAGLGALAGVPTIAGAWIGGLSYSPVATVLFLAIGAGAVIQVVFAIGRLLSRRVSPPGERGAWFARPLNVAGLIAGLTIMYITGLWVTV